MKKKICVVGSSYIGAVYTAYKEHKSRPDRYEVDFYGQGNARFPHVEISNGHVRKARFKSRDKSLPVREYDAFVVYGDLPAPHDLAKVIQQCVQRNASQQLMKTLVKDVVRSTNTFRLGETVRALNGKPVLIMSGNIALAWKAELDKRRHSYIISLLRDALKPHRYLPFPRELFSDNFRPNSKYYKSSIDLTGRKVDASSTHDNHHMNEQGGLLMLNAIFGALDKVFRCEEL